MAPNSNPCIGRAFIDTCLCRIIVKHGEYIWDGGDLPADPKFYERSGALADLEALRDLCYVAQGYGLPWLITEQSLFEIFGSRRSEDHYYGMELFRWAQANPRFPKDGTAGNNRAHRLFEPALAGRLGKGDQALLRDAVVANCGVFLTWELKLIKLSDAICEETGLRVVGPAAYARLLFS